MKKHHRALLGAVIATAAMSTAAAPAMAQGRIVGGTAVPEGKYPFMVSVQTSSGSHFCGGTLIDASWVLTAAHCTVGRSASSTRARVGITFLSDSDTTKTFGVSSIRIHPSYGTPKDDSNDVSLLELSSPADTARFPPIKVATAAQDSSESGTFTTSGWGTTRQNGFCCPNQMREVDVPFVSDATCGAAYGTFFDAPTMLCAGERGKDSCQGDSGGPLFKVVGGAYTEFGVVSWGNGCARKGFPGVYSELNNAGIRSWIQGFVPGIGA